MVPPLPLSHINHISLVVRDLQASISFYQHVLGFTQIRRPGSFDESFDGAWMWRNDMAIHLIVGEPPLRSPVINVFSDHLSFQPLATVAEIEDCLKGHGIRYIMQTVVEGNLAVPQLFFHDPDLNMIEICPCDCLPIRPMSASCALDLEATARNNQEISPAISRDSSEVSGDMLASFD